MKQRNIRKIATVCLIVSCIIYGISFVVVKDTLTKVEPVAFLAGRFLVSFLFINFLLIFKGFSLDLKGKRIGILVLLSCLNPIVYYSLETFALRLISASEAGIIVAMYPAVTAILGYFLLKEKLPRHKSVLVVVTVITGIGIVVAKNVIGLSNIFGSIVFILAIIIAGIHTILSRESTRTFTPFEITYLMSFFGFVFFNGVYVINLLKDNRINNYFELFMKKEILFSILYLGICCSILGVLLVNFALKHIKANIVAIFSNLETITAIFLGAIILKETITIFDIVGSSIILICICIISNEL